jgi:phosphonate metabolism protein PhnN/1,5-bisphosphokinase (PRPP-forming)
MTGRLVLVVGPSGTGKDTLIGAAREALRGDARYVFPRRTITRAAMVELEDHDTADAAAFARLAAAGAFALTWQAHGLSYGLPAGIAGDIAAGRVVICNGSRTMVEAARQKFPGTQVVLIDATPEVRAARLMGRGRESAGEIAARLAREGTQAPAGAVRIDNSGPREEGIGRFIMALRQMAED